MTETAPTIHVLLVADLHDEWQRVYDVLKALGCDVTVISSDDEAFTYLQEHVTVDLVLMDSSFVADGGMQFLQRRQANPGLRSVPVIVGGFQFSDESLLKYVDLGVSDLLLLPLDRLSVMSSNQAEG